MSDKMTPNVRFEGFTDAWEQRKLGDLAKEFKSGKGLSAKRIKKEGKYPVYGGNGIRGYTDEYNHEGDFALIGRQGALSGNMSYSSGRAFFTEHAVAVSANDNNDTRFLFYLMTKMQLGKWVTQSAQPGLAVGTLVAIKTYLPQKKEQLCIHQLLDDVDNTIVHHQKKVENLQQLKKLFLQKIFAQEWRFKGFTDPWEQRKLSSLFKRRAERNNGEFGITRWISVAKMYFQNPEKVQSNNLDTRTYVMRRGDIAFEGHPNKEYEFGRFVENDIGDGIVSELFPIYQHVGEYDLKFWKFFIHQERLMNRIFAHSITSSGNSSNKLNGKHFLRQYVVVPSNKEQAEIGEILNHLNYTIVHHQKKLNQLKQLKKWLLQNMFV